MRPELLALCLAATAVHAAPSAADRARAKSEFQRGQKAYDLGDFQAALDAYSEAYRLDERPGFLFNVAQCHRQLGNHERASFFLGRFLSYYPPGKAPNDKLARELLAESEARVKQAPPAVVSEPPPRDVPAPPPATPPAPPPALEPAPFPSAALEPSPVPEARQADGLFHQWWFWGAVGVVAASAITAGALGAARPRARETTQSDGSFK